MKSRVVDRNKLAKKLCCSGKDHINKNYPRKIRLTKGRIEQAIRKDGLKMVTDALGWVLRQKHHERLEAKLGFPLRDPVTTNIKAATKIIYKEIHTKDWLMWAREKGYE